MRFIRKHLNIIIIITVFIIISMVIILKSMLVKASSIEETLNSEIEIAEEEFKEKTEDKKEQSITKYVKVDIKGEVNKPGVYTLEEKSRVVDVINKAGGLTKKADTSTVNLAKIVTDEMVIIIYSKEEIENLKKESSSNNKIPSCLCPIIENDANIKENEPEDETNEEEKINLNTASIEKLKEVPGLGQTKAEAIIKYRQEYGFKQIEDLLNIDGIGNTTYEKIKNYFTLS